MKTMGFLGNIHQTLDKRFLLSFGMWYGLLGCMLFFPAGLFSQTLTGTIRGEVVSASQDLSLPYAKVFLIERESEKLSLTDVEGKFFFESVPIGRHELRVEVKGYHTRFFKGVLVKTAKEAVVQARMQPIIYEMEEVVLLPAKEKGEALNDMSTVSAISFDVEEMRKFAGGLDDPARLAANLPGVMSNPFISDNMISIRGNSPRGMVYRLEGIDVPNPNHFARIGASGGSFTLFSLQTLDRSDFFLSAFPAEYGNATAGVFDIQMRRGNNQKHEFTFQAGVLGFDFSAEGPLKGKRASYLINYRFASFNLAKWLTNNNTIASYQDVNLKFHFPTEKAGTFTLFGVGGVSERPKPAVEDSALWEGDIDRFENVLASNMFLLGLKHVIPLGAKTLWQSTAAVSGNLMKDNKNFLQNDLSYFEREVNEYRRSGFSFASFVQHQFSPKHRNKTGIILKKDFHDYFSRKYDYVDEEYRLRADEKGESLMFQAYSQSKINISPQLSLNIGVHALYYDINEETSIEPRLGLSYQFTPKQRLALGYGRHSRVEHFATYFSNFGDQNVKIYPNERLEFLKTHQVVLGYYTTFSDKLKFRVEAYYQYLFDVPVEINGTYSVVNIDELNQLRELVNAGTATIYGMDLGLERFTFRGLYYLINLSLFNSTYTDVEGREFNTAYNHGIKFNLLTGREWKVGKKKNYNKLLGINGNFSLRGGQRFTPIDLVASRLAQETVLDERVPFVEQDPNLFLVDLTFTLRSNRKKHSDVFALQIKNLFQSRVAEYREYDPLLDEAVTLRASSIFPVLSYKLEF